MLSNGQQYDDCLLYSWSLIYVLILLSAKVRSFVTCCECQKRRIVYSAARFSKKEEEAITRASEELYYVCGTTLFEEGAFAGKLVVKESINCTTPIETAYFAGLETPLGPYNFK